jgi:fatty-acyl-CoA synthase
VSASVQQRRDALEARDPLWRSTTIAQALDAAAARYPNRPLILTDEATYTYGEMVEWSRQLAAGLITLGVKPGDHVATIMGNHPEFIALKFAIAWAGAVAVPINYFFRREELNYVIKQSDTTVLVTMDAFRGFDYLAVLDALAPGWESSGGGENFPRLKEIVVFPTARGAAPRGMSLEELADLGTPSALEALDRRQADLDPRAPSDIIYTSGTTGRPKGVMLTHEGVLRTAYGSAYHRAFEDGRRILTALPLYHVFGYVEGFLPVLYVGGALIPQAEFDAVATLRAIERHRATEVLFVPTMTLAVLEALHEGTYDLSSLRVVFSSGGQSPVRIWQQVRDDFGVEEVFTAYGMTETTASTTCTRPDDPLDRLATTNGCFKPAGAAGDPEFGGLLAVYKTIDPGSGKDLPLGTEGELVARGPIVTRGYYNKPEETAAAFNDDGWLLTGDIGRIDADGYLTLTGRRKEMFRCGGENVVPKEVEDVLTSHPEVEQAHVVGVPHDRLGEVGCVWVVARHSASPDPDDLIAYCAARLARFKVPKYVIFAKADELPTTATGKIQKFQLVEWSVKRLQEGASCTT